MTEKEETEIISRLKLIAMCDSREYIRIAASDAIRLIEKLKKENKKYIEKFIKVTDI